MKPSTISHSILFATTVLVVPCAAQLPTMAPYVPPEIAQGLFSNLPLGMTISEAGGPDLWMTRAPGVNGGAPTPWSAALYGAGAEEHPDFSAAALALGLNLPTNAPPPRFGGISTGGEIMPEVNSSGVMQMQPGNWYMLSISVSSASVGRNGSLLAARRVGRDASGDILSYYTVGSTGINPVFPDTVRLEYSREQLQLPAAAPSQPNPPLSTTPARSIENQDFGIGVLSIDPNERGIKMFPVRNCFYFTLTKSWVNDMSAVNSSYTIDGQPPNAATIYVLTWKSLPNFHWSEPKIALDNDVLFPGVDASLVEIDALSVDRGVGREPDFPKRAVFSLTPLTDVLTETTYDQILVYQDPLVNPCPTTALKTTEMVGANAIVTPVSGKMGLVPRGFGPNGEPITTGEPDDVRSTCGGDPKESGTLNALMGYATPETPAGAGTLGLTAVRVTLGGTSVNDDDASGEPQDTLHVQVTGLALSPHPYGLVYVDFTGGVAGRIGPVLIDPSWGLRNTVDFALPLNAPPTTTTTEMRAYIVWVTNLNPLTTVLLGESWALRMKL